MNLFADHNDKNSIENIKMACLKISASTENIIKAAYKNSYMLVNNVLCKNPFTSSAIDSVLGFKKPTKKISFVMIIMNLAGYYRSSIKHFKLLLVKIKMFREVGRNAKRRDGVFYIIDVFIPVSKIVASGKFVDENSLPGIYDFLDRQGIDYAVLPTLYDDTNSVEGLGKALQILSKEKNKNFIYGYELLGKFDILKILLFVLFYPFVLLRLTSKKTLFSDNVGAIIRDEIIRNIGQVRLYEYARMLFGKKIEKMYGSVNVLSWYENQPHQKCFYKGFKKSHIAALILYPYHNSYELIEPTKAELEFKTLPDIFLVSSNGKLKNFEGFNARTAPSLRNQQLIDLIKNKDSSSADKFVIILPYDTYMSQVIIDIVAKSAVLKNGVIIKKHPAKDEFTIYGKEDWELSCLSFYDLLKVAKIIISTESSTTIESVCYGVPVILIGMPDRHTPCYFFDENRGVIWDMVYDEKELDTAIESLLTQQIDSILLQKITESYFNYYFTKLSEVGFEVFLNHKQKREAQ